MPKDKTHFKPNYEPVVAWGSFFILLATYWLTVAPSVSFWDCPEYVSAAYLLEIGHPPGNPTWMLVERIITLFVPPQYAALAINLSSGLFTAFAGYFLARTLYTAALWVLARVKRRYFSKELGAAGAALTGALAFGWCDSTWFSAVEAEVYAMSIFMTSLCVWLMIKWAVTDDKASANRLLILIAYLFGLSIGVHQLNLLCIPALAMIWAVKRGIRSAWRLLFIFILSGVAVGCILVGMMSSTIALAAEFELIAVNKLNMPYLSGVAIYVALLGISLLVSLFAVSRSSNRYLMAVACWPSIFLSGIFILAGHFLAGAIVSAVVAALLVCGRKFKPSRLYMSMWMLAMILCGYSSYALIPIRGNVAAPSNAAMPDNPFSFATYLGREQYGAAPLLYGNTPYSKPMLEEKIDSSGHASYKYYKFIYDHPVYSRNLEGGRRKKEIRGMTREDSLENERLLARGDDAYIMRGLHGRHVLTPELDMWFPRLTGRDTYDIECYSDWIGMDSASMVSVDISEAIDSAGNYVTKMDSEGKRGKAKSLRPTYLQHLQWFVVYQTTYMYWRYMMWNFVGRQNDRPAQGEVQHGNFITGFPVVDNAMLGAEDHLPPVAGSENKGRNRYFGLPLILGLIGMFWLLKSRRRGEQTCFVIAVLFFMTGLAITIYLNQGPGEPRERDYSFLGSYMAFAMWMGFGAVAVARMTKSKWGFLIPLAIVCWMGFENFDDHDRSGRNAAREFAASILNSVEKDAVIFVNGDNLTFPLWYAQEVENIRPDVRVINLAYFASPTYAVNMMEDWRESRGIETVLQKNDIAWDAFRFAKVPLSKTDTMPAIEALQKLRESESLEFPTRYVSLQVSPDSTAVYDLRNLSNSSGFTEFNNLLMFDVVANSIQAGRPVYWMGALGPESRIGLNGLTSPWMYGERFGLLKDEAVDSLMLEQALRTKSPVALNRDVYMDHSPSLQVSIMRGALMKAARRLLENGHLDDALRIAEFADVSLGHSPDSYTYVLVADTTQDVRKELAKLLADCADSLENRMAERSNVRNDKMLDRVLEIRIRSDYHLREAMKREKDWKEYRKALPRRLKNKVSQTY